MAHASNAPHTNKQRFDLKAKEINRPVREARRAVKRSSAEGRKGAVKLLRRTLRRARRARCERKLNAVALHRPRAPLPTVLKFNGQVCTDRGIWVQEALLFGEARFGNPLNDPNTQAARLRQLLSVSDSAISEGRPPPDVTRFDVLAGRSKIKSGSAAGADGCPPEVYRAFPFSLVVHIWRQFQERHGGLSTDDPPSWKIMTFMGDRESNFC